MDALPDDGNLQHVKLVIYQAPVENQPRLLLRYLAMGIPVIAYTDCGIPNGLFAHLTLVKDYPSFRSAVQFVLENK